MGSLLRKRMASNLEKGGEEGEGLITLSEQLSLASDRYRMLFARIDRLCRTEEKQDEAQRMKVIAMTSSIKGEGKTTTTANMAVVAARDFGKRCLVIDGDFKSPTLARRFGMPEEPGLIDVIEGKCKLGAAMRRGPVENLAVLAMGRGSGPFKSGAGVRKEINVWTSPEMKAVLAEVRGWFDYIWVDAPPIIPLFDMSLISQVVDGILLVVQSGEIREELLTQAVKSLGSSKVIGCVMNRAKLPWSSRYYEYGY